MAHDDHGDVDWLYFVHCADLLQGCNHFHLRNAFSKVAAMELPGVRASRRFMVVVCLVYVLTDTGSEHANRHASAVLSDDVLGNCLCECVGIRPLVQQAAGGRID